MPSLNHQKVMLLSYEIIEKKSDFSFHIYIYILFMFLCLINPKLCCLEEEVVLNLYAKSLNREK